MLLDGKVAVVTGAGQGIGFAIAKALAAHGAKVVVNDINPATADQAVAHIQATGAIACADHSDISSFAGADRLIEHCMDSYGKIDAMVNNAGILRDRMSFNMTEEEWDAVIAVCLKGTFGCARAAIREMKRAATRGRVINITSRSGLRGSIGQANYAAAKAGVLGLTRTLSQEVAKYGITVNAVSPRADTAMTKSVPANVRARKDASWVGGSVIRRGTPDQVAPMIVYLASDETHFINGQVIGIGGDKIGLWSHPHELAEGFMVGGWTVETLREVFPSSIGFELEKLGLKD